MYRFLILAYNKEIVINEMPMLDKATEIWLVAETTAQALVKARSVFLAQFYLVKRVEQLLDVKKPEKKKKA